MLPEAVKRTTCLNKQEQARDTACDRNFFTLMPPLWMQDSVLPCVLTLHTARTIGNEVCCVYSSVVKLHQRLQRHVFMMQRRLLCILSLFKCQTVINTKRQDHFATASSKHIRARCVTLKSGFYIINYSSLLGSGALSLDE